LGKAISVESKLAVPKLAPGKSKTGASSFLEHFPPIFDYGTYKTQICADAGSPHKVKERNEKNNCKSMGPFYVIPAHLKGTVSGIRKYPLNLTLTWEGAVDFEAPTRALSSGYFVYELAPPASLKFTVSGSIVVDGKVCNWTGTATYVPAGSEKDSVVLKFGSTHYYNVGNFIRKGFKMNYFLSCDGSIPFPLDLSGTAWMKTGANKAIPDPGLTRLSGHFSESSAGVSTTYTWNLQALDE
jgi:hypothetical protein